MSAGSRSARATYLRVLCSVPASRIYSITLGTVLVSSLVGARKVWSYEQKEVRENLEKLRTEVKKTQDKDEAADHFIRLIKETTCPEQLTENLVGNLIDRVEVGEAYYEDGKKKQEIHILFNFVGEVGRNEINRNEINRNEIEWTGNEWDEIDGDTSEQDENDWDKNKRDKGDGDGGSGTDEESGNADNGTENSVYEIEGGRRPRRK